MKGRTSKASLAARILAGTLGAYAVTAMLTVVTTRILIRVGADRVEAVTGATLVSFALFACLSMLAFHARRTARSWACFLAIGLICCVAILALPPG